MEHIIDVTIKDKVAYCSGARYVCGNSDYVIHFDFDDEWTEFETKTARFKCEKGYFDIVFSGDVCAVPVITDTDFFSVGVYAGNIHTTTPAHVRVYKSILCGDMDPYVGPPGKDGVGIQSVEQTTTSTEDGGINIVTVTKTDGEASTFEVRNGSRGGVGPAGADGKDGKSAYAYAVEGGYTGTEAEFAEKMAAPLPGVDDTLTKPGQAADAAKVGEELRLLSDENVRSAELDEDNVVSFKNSAGLVLFTLDLSELGTPASYGNLVLSAESLTIAEGGTGDFTVALDSAPSANQIVYLAVSDNTRLSVSPATLTFTPENWNTPQTVTVSSAQDDDNVDDSITVRLTSKNVDGKQLVVTVSDNYYVPQLVTDGLVLHFDYSGTDRSSDIITDLAGGVTASGWSTTIPGANGVIGATKPITVDTSTEAWANFVAEMKGSTEGFTIEQFASGFGKTFNFTGANNVADKAMVSNLSSYPGSTFFILTPAIYYKNQSNESVYASYSVDGVILLSDGSKIAPNTNSDLLKKLPNWNNYAHTVIRFYPDGTCKRTINGCQYESDGVISDFASFDFDAMFSKFYILPSCDEIEERWYKTQRIYNRILTEDEIKNNETVEASKLVLSTF